MRAESPVQIHSGVAPSALTPTPVASPAAAPSAAPRDFESQAREVLERDLTDQQRADMTQSEANSSATIAHALAGAVREHGVLDLQRFNGASVGLVQSKLEQLLPLFNQQAKLLGSKAGITNVFLNDQFCFDAGLANILVSAKVKEVFVPAELEPSQPIRDFLHNGSVNVQVVSNGAPSRSDRLPLPHSQVDPGQLVPVAEPATRKKPATFDPVQMSRNMTLYLDQGRARDIETHVAEVAGHLASGSITADEAVNALSPLKQVSLLKPPSKKQCDAVRTVLQCTMGIEALSQSQRTAILNNIIPKESRYNETIFSCQYDGERIDWAVSTTIGILKADAQPQDTQAFLKALGVTVEDVVKEMSKKVGPTWLRFKDEFASEISSEGVRLKRAIGLTSVASGRKTVRGIDKATKLQARVADLQVVRVLPKSQGRGMLCSTDREIESEVFTSHDFGDGKGNLRDGRYYYRIPLENLKPESFIGKRWL